MLSHALGKPFASWFTLGRSGSLLLMITLAGCGSAEPPRVAVFPVSGTLHVAGKPAENAQLTLHPTSPLLDSSGRQLFPNAIVAADGSFEVLTYADGDGAPPGEYRLTVVWPRVTIEGGEPVYGEDRLRGRYSTPNKPAATIEVKAETNQLAPLNLK